MKAADFVGLLFLARDVAHSVHLNTRSYAIHKATQKFYEGLPDLADTFAEAWQGAHGLMGPVSLMSAEKNRDLVEFLEDQLDQINKGRYEFCDREETAIQNIIDEIVSHYLSAIYKLRFLE
jgi:DNA-binding ferritin-like protein